MILTGLTRNTDLNGRRVALVDFTDGRWDVVLPDGTQLRVRRENLEPDVEAARDTLRDRGLPQSAAYLSYQLGRQAGLSGAQNPRPAMEQVARRPRKNNGAVVTGLTEKNVEVSDVAVAFGGETETKVTTLKDSTWQLDILDYSRQDAIVGYALVAVDVANRQVYGELMADKSAIETRDAFARMIGDDEQEPKTSSDPGVPAMVDTDHDRAFTGAFRLYLEQKGITHRLKTDAKYSHNNLGSVDNVMGRIRSYLRKRLTEEAVPGRDNVRDWPNFFEEAVEAQNEKRYNVLSNMRPTELYNKDNKPQNEAAEHTIFKIQKDMAAGFAKNKRKQDNLKSEIDRTQTFRVPIDIGYQPGRFSRRITQSLFSGQTHKVDVAATDARGNPSRVVSQRDGRSYPLSTIDIVEASSADVTIPERLQRNPRRQRADMERHLDGYLQAGVEYLLSSEAGPGNYEGQELGTDAQEATVEDFGEHIVGAVPPNTYDGFRQHLSEVGIRAGAPNRLYVKFIEFWRAVLGLRNRKKVVFLREDRREDEDPDDLPPDVPEPAPPPPRERSPSPPPPPRPSPEPRPQDPRYQRLNRLGLSYLYRAPALPAPEVEEELAPVAAVSLSPEAEQLLEDFRAWLTANGKSNPKMYVSAIRSLIANSTAWSETMYEVAQGLGDNNQGIAFVDNLDVAVAGQSTPFTEALYQEGTQFNQKVSMVRLWQLWRRGGETGASKKKNVSAARASAQAKAAAPASADEEARIQAALAKVEAGLSGNQQTKRGRKNKFEQFLRNARGSEAMRVILEWFDSRHPGLRGLALADAITEQDWKDLQVYLQNIPNFPLRRGGRSVAYSSAATALRDDLRKAWQAYSSDQ